MSNEDAFYIVGNIPIPLDDENYDLCQYQEAKAIALDCIQKIDDIKDLFKPKAFGEYPSSYEDIVKEIQKILEE